MTLGSHSLTDRGHQDLTLELDVYAEHFGLRGKPFHVTPDPCFFYPNPTYQEAYASLLYGIIQRKGFIVLTGEVGTGKTTLLRRLMTNLEASVHFAFVYNTTWTFDEVLEAICSDFEIPRGGIGPVEKIQALNAFLLKRLERGETAAVLIDEAHNLSVEALENLRLLSNLETGREKLLQLVLVGQNELELKLTQFALRQLKDRVAIWCRLDRLKEREVGPFILHRLRTIGYDKQDLFTPDAIQRIATYSQGSPRQINIICDNALLLAYGSYQNRVSAQIIEEVARDFLLKDNNIQIANGTRKIAQLPTEPSGATSPLQETNVSTTSTSGTAEIVPAATTTRNEEKEREEPSHPQSNRLSLAKIMIVLVLLFSAAGIWALQSSGTYSSQLNLTVNKLSASFNDWLTSVRPKLPSRFTTETGPSDKQNEIPGQTGTGTADVVWSVVQNVPQFSADQKDEKQDAQRNASTVPSSAPSHPQVTEEQEGMAVRDKLPAQGSQPQTVPISENREGQLVAVPHNTTVFDLASKIYGERTVLALDLIKESNPQVDDLNRVLEGQQLWMPALTRETLLRPQSDGSFRLILAAFRTLGGAEARARQIRRKGYVVQISPQKVAETVWLYRIEILGLQDPTAIEKAWKFASQKSIPARPAVRESLETNIADPQSRSLPPQGLSAN